MYGKIFESIYDGTLRANWKALITFQQLIILGGPEGIVDMTMHAIHGRTGIPLDIIEEGIKHLTEPDPYSRSPAEDGRRLVLIDPSRPWGWRLVNHSYYRDLFSREDKRLKDRARIAAKRRKATKTDMSQPVADSREQSQSVVLVAHTYTDSYTDTNTNETTTTTRSAEADPIGFVFEYWQKKLDHPKAILTDDRRAKIARSLKNYAPADLCKAIDGCAVTPYNMGDNDRGEKYDDIELILRDAKHVERFMRNADNPPQPRTPTSQQSEMQRAANALRSTRDATRSNRAIPAQVPGAPAGPSAAVPGSTVHGASDAGGSADPRPNRR